MTDSGIPHPAGPEVPYGGAGVRQNGADPVDTAALEDVLLRLGRLADDLPEVAELDLNPVLAGPAGVIAVDAKLRLAPVGAEPDPTLRRLRPADRL
jgi:ATP-grasp domain